MMTNYSSFLFRCMVVIFFSAGCMVGFCRAAELGSIMILGDSITQGTALRLPPDDGGYSYRYPFWKKLVDAGYTFDLVGSLNTTARGDVVYPDYNGYQFDPNHEGHWGWTALGVLTGAGSGAPGSGSGTLSQWLTGYTPDVALVLIGTNDITTGGDAPTVLGRLDQIIDLIQGDNPDVMILLGQIIPRVMTAAHREVRTQVNDGLSTLASENTTANSVVVVVDLSSGFTTAANTYDGIHPDASGEEIIASRFIEALQGQSGEPDASVEPMHGIVNIDIGPTLYTGQGALPAPGDIWNQAPYSYSNNVSTSAGFIDASDSEGNATTIDFTASATGSGVSAFNNSTVPHALTMDGLLGPTNGSGIFTFSGLNDSGAYDIVIYGSVTDYGVSITIDGVTLSASGSKNAVLVEGVDYVVFTDVQSVSGEISGVWANNSGTRGVLNAVQIKVKPLPGRLDSDNDVDFVDFSIFAQNWLRCDCSDTNNNCEYADIWLDGCVNMSDLAIFAEHWLEQ